MIHTVEYAELNLYMKVQLQEAPPSVYQISRLSTFCGGGIGDVLLVGGVTI